MNSPDFQPRPPRRASSTPLRQGRRFVVLSVGGVVLLAGLLVSPLPGPGFTILGPIGLAILATEFAWARRLLREFDNRSDIIERRAPWLASPWGVLALLLVIILYWLLALLIARSEPEHARTTWILAGVIFLPISGLASFIALAARRRWLASRARRGD